MPDVLAPALFTGKPKRLRGRTRDAILLAIVFFPVVSGMAEQQPSHDLAQALAAAERARTLPKGQEYIDAFQAGLRGTIYDILGDCMGHVPGWQRPQGFRSVLIIGKTGKLKWIIRDARDPMTNCALKKLLKASLPPPPADNWPVTFNFGVQRHSAPGSG
ncbi:MAG: hypothetical protein H0X40_18830 [Chthoniobacterales bacterium]|nr:hypothetical protein [Chthoniobacterales bacterium]